MKITTECFKFEKLTIEVVSVEGEGCCGTFHPGERFSIDSLAPEGLCPFLYHMALPYIEAANNNAVFNNTPNNNILSQCPNPEAAIDVLISCANNEEVEIAYDKKKSECPYYDFKSGVQWKITAKDTPFCPRAYDSLFPYLIAASTRKRLEPSYEECFTITCPAYPGYVVFSVGIE